MKAATLLALLLGCAAVTYAGRDRDSFASSRSESDNASESTHFTWPSFSHRSAGCWIIPASANDSGNVHGYARIYQKRAGKPVWIKGILAGLGGPAGTAYALAFHQGPANSGCANIGETMQNIGGDVTHIVSKGQNSRAGIKARSATISMEESSANSVIGHSMALREVTTGKVVACCSVQTGDVDPPL
ncbi:uncharacterized protein LOC124162896 [Ischnura elegans]|uniref:uncharacterized protein LOC124162896 n=1 Tax=Ischnura elegans TaxID=197161 RepID=UPI001ED878EB|nr:uncharacterized protein LOC124162896 [Ischnura elegans]